MKTLMPAEIREAEQAETVADEYVQPGRKVAEWVGKTADTPIPAKVKQRIWIRERGRCYLTGRKINALKDSFEYEHVIPVGLDGAMNRESNLRLALTEPHKAKTVDDRAAIRKADRNFLKHNNLWPEPKGNNRLQSRPFDKGPRGSFR